MKYDYLIVGAGLFGAAFVTPKNTRCDNVTTRVDENKKGMHFPKRPKLLSHCHIDYI